MSSIETNADNIRFKINNETVLELKKSGNGTSLSTGTEKSIEISGDGGLATQDGDINGTTVGLTTPAAAKFTDVTVTKDLIVEGNIKVHGDILDVSGALGLGESNTSYAPVDKKRIYMNSQNKTLNLYKKETISGKTTKHLFTENPWAASGLDTVHWSLFDGETVEFRGSAAANRYIDMGGIAAGTTVDFRDIRDYTTDTGTTDTIDAYNVIAPGAANKGNIYPKITSLPTDLTRVKGLSNIKGSSIKVYLEQYGELTINASDLNNTKFDISVITNNNLANQNFDLTIVYNQVSDIDLIKTLSANWTTKFGGSDGVPKAKVSVKNLVRFTESITKAQTKKLADIAKKGGRTNRGTVLERVQDVATDVGIDWTLLKGSRYRVTNPNTVNLYICNINESVDWSQAGNKIENRFDTNIKLSDFKSVNLVWEKASQFKSSSNFNSGTVDNRLDSTATGDKVKHYIQSEELDLTDALGAAEKNITSGNLISKISSHAVLSPDFALTQFSGKVAEIVAEKDRVTETGTTLRIYGGNAADEVNGAELNSINTNYGTGAATRHAKIAASGIKLDVVNVYGTLDALTADKISYVKAAGNMVLHCYEKGFTSNDELKGLTDLKTGKVGTINVGADAANASKFAGAATNTAAATIVANIFNISKIDGIKSDNAKVTIQPADTTISGTLFNSIKAGNINANIAKILKIDIKSGTVSIKQADIDYQPTKIHYSKSGNDTVVTLVPTNASNAIDDTIMGHVKAIIEDNKGNTGAILKFNLPKLVGSAGAGISIANSTYDNVTKLRFPINNSVLYLGEATWTQPQVAKITTFATQADNNWAASNDGIIFDVANDVTAKVADINVSGAAAAVNPKDIFQFKKLNAGAHDVTLKISDTTALDNAKMTLIREVVDITKNKIKELHITGTTDITSTIANVINHVGAGGIATAGDTCTYKFKKANTELKLSDAGYDDGVTAKLNLLNALVVDTDNNFKAGDGVKFTTAGTFKSIETLFESTKIKFGAAAAIEIYQTGEIDAASTNATVTMLGRNTNISTIKYTGSDDIKGTVDNLSNSKMKYPTSNTVITLSDAQDSINTNAKLVKVKALADLTTIKGTDGIVFHNRQNDLNYDVANNTDATYFTGAKFKYNGANSVLKIKPTADFTYNQDMTALPNNLSSIAIKENGTNRVTLTKTIILDTKLDVDGNPKITISDELTKAEAAGAEITANAGAGLTYTIADTIDTLEGYNPTVAGHTVTGKTNGGSFDLAAFTAMVKDNTKYDIVNFNSNSFRAISNNVQSAIFKADGSYQTGYSDAIIGRIRNTTLNIADFTLAQIGKFNSSVSFT